MIYNIYNMCVNINAHKFRILEEIKLAAMFSHCESKTPETIYQGHFCWQALHVGKIHKCNK